jgi:hypothetical protein
VIYRSHPYLVLHVRTADSSARMAFLLEDVTALTAPVADAASFTDLGGGWLELLIIGAEKRLLAAQLARALTEERAMTVARSAEALVINSARFPDAVERQECVDELFLLSDRALGILLKHPDVPVPDELIAAEVLALHRRRGDMKNSIAWQIAWLDPAADGPQRSPTASVELTVRLAHSQWLRLTGGIPNSQAEASMLKTYR